jgi:hypothetical protein
MSDTTLFMMGTFVSFIFAAGVFVRGAWFFIKLDSVIDSVPSEALKPKL